MSFVKENGERGKAEEEGGSGKERRQMSHLVVDVRVVALLTHFPGPKNSSLPNVLPFSGNAMFLNSPTFITSSPAIFCQQIVHPSLKSASFKTTLIANKLFLPLISLPFP